MLVPFLSSIQNVEKIDNLPEILQKIARIFNNYPVDQRILLSLATAVIALLLKNLFLSINAYLRFWLSGKIVSEIRIKSIDTLMKAGIQYYNDTKSGTIVEKVRNNTNSIKTMISVSWKIVVNLTNFLVMFILLLIFSWQLTILSILFSVIVAVVISTYINKLSIMSKKTAESNREFTSHLIETINGIQLIKSFVKEKLIFRKLNNKIEKIRKRELRHSLRSYTVNLLTEILSIIAIVILFIYIFSTSKVDGALLITQIIPFIYILTRIFPIVKSLNQSRATIATGLPYIEIIEDLIRLDNKSVVKDGNIDFNGLSNGITFNSVSFTYKNTFNYAIHKNSFFIPKGKTTAIVGESGAGKTTIINLLLRFYDPQDGTIFIDDQPLNKLKLNSYREKLGIVSQDTFIFNDSVKNNISFGALTEPDDQTIINAAIKAGAHNFIQKLSEGYETILGDRGVILSGGQRQRISIARAILKDPEILILDEATSSLDSRMEKQIHESILELSRNRTIIIIAHRLTTIDSADNIIVLKNGKVLEIGNADQLLQKKGEYHQLVHQSNLS